jgi:environmental stress-induced protein Ves
MASIKTNYIPRDMQQTIAWASGTTTELFIYPSGSGFQERNFRFRISTATVDADETDFSDFSNLTRILMVLEGDLFLTHEGHYSKLLGPFDQDQFDGGWKTKSRGKVRDFNVIFNEEVNASVFHITLESGQVKTIAINTQFVFFYVFEGVFECDGQRLNQGDFFQLSQNQPSSIDLQCLNTGVLVCIEIELGEN